MVVSVGASVQFSEPPEEKDKRLTRDRLMRSEEGLTKIAVPSLGDSGLVEPSYGAERPVLAFNVCERRKRRFDRRTSVERVDGLSERRASENGVGRRYLLDIYVQAQHHPHGVGKVLYGDGGAGVKDARSRRIG